MSSLVSSHSGGWWIASFWTRCAQLLETLRLTRHVRRALGNGQRSVREHALFVAHVGLAVTPCGWGCVGGRGGYDPRSGAARQRCQPRPSVSLPVPGRLPLWGTFLGADA